MVKSEVGMSATKVGVMLTPDQIAAAGTEHAHQCAFFQWIAIDGQRTYRDCDLFFAVPNGGDRSAHVGASLKAEGVKAGVPDTCLPVPIGRYAGLYVEFKKPGVQTKPNGGLSDKQIKWCRRLVENHYAVLVCYGWAEAVEAVGCYYRGEPLDDFLWSRYCAP